MDMFEFFRDDFFKKVNKTHTLATKNKTKQKI